MSSGRCQHKAFIVILSVYSRAARGRHVGHVIYLVERVVFADVPLRKALTRIIVTGTQG
jgi:hypothetical protein